MIIFKKTKTISGKTFMVFANEHGSEHSIMVDETVASYFLHNFNLLSPGKEVEAKSQEDSEGN